MEKEKKVLPEKYKELYKYIMDSKGYSLSHILSGFMIWSPDPDSNENKICNDLGGYDFYNNSCTNDFLTLIVDIYNDKYKLDEPEYLWVLDLNTTDNCVYLAYRDEKGTLGLLYLDIPYLKVNTSCKMTIQEFKALLEHANTSLTIDNFCHLDKVQISNLVESGECNETKE